MVLLPHVVKEIICMGLASSQVKKILDDTYQNYIHLKILLCIPVPNFINISRFLKRSRNGLLHSESLGFRTLSIVLNSKELDNITLFSVLSCDKKTYNQLCPVERANLNTVSETLCFQVMDNSRRWIKPRIQLIMIILKSV
jgi:hypothetical protein